MAGYYPSMSTGGSGAQWDPETGQYIQGSAPYKPFVDPKNRQEVFNTSVTSPWDAQQPFLLDIFNQAQRAYKNTNATPYGGLTLSPTNPLWTQGMQLQSGVASNSVGMGNAALGYSGGLNKLFVDNMSGPATEKNLGLKAAPSYAQTATKDSTGIRSDLLGVAGGPLDYTDFSVAGQMGQLSPFAGDYSLSGQQAAVNAALHPAYRSLTEEILPSIRTAGAQGAGYRGGKFQDLQSRAIADFNDSIARETAAQSLALKGLETTNRGNLLGAATQDASSLRSNTGTDWRTMLQTGGETLNNQLALKFNQTNNINSLLSGDNQALNELLAKGTLTREMALPGIAESASGLVTTGYNQNQMPGQTMEQVGQKYTQNEQATLDDAYRRWTEANAAPWAGLDAYTRAVGGNYGTSSSGTVNSPAQGGSSTGSRFLTGALGGGALGIAGASALGVGASATGGALLAALGPYGLAAGVLGGLLGVL